MRIRSFVWFSPKMFRCKARVPPPLYGYVRSSAIFPLESAIFMLRKNGHPPYSTTRCKAASWEYRFLVYCAVRRTLCCQGRELLFALAPGRACGLNLVCPLFYHKSCQHVFWDKSIFLHDIVVNASECHSLMSVLRAKDKLWKANEE